jgi:hypothetical protein
MDGILIASIISDFSVCHRPNHFGYTMNTQPIFDTGSTLFPRSSAANEASRGGADRFGAVLDASLSRDGTAGAGRSSEALPQGLRGVVFGPSNELLRFNQTSSLRREAAAAYARQAGTDNHHPAGTEGIDGGTAGKSRIEQAARDVPYLSEKSVLPSYPTSVGGEGAAIAPLTPVPRQAPSTQTGKDGAGIIALKSAPGKDSTQGSGWQKYKDDQLLRNPGGDHYYLDENRVADDPGDRESFVTRVGKDMSDFFGNVKNFFGNLLMGSKFRYRDENNDIKEATQRGLVGTCVDFFKDLGSALTFGLWHPDEEKGPQGAMERITYFGSKMKEAFLGDLVEGIPQSVNHMAKNVVLAGLNLVQVIPDATIGNLEEGRKLTTTIFDNGQVMVEYLTDVIPSGDAWFRVHAASLTDVKAPILYNLQMPEHAKGDARWQYVRNTPFRKTIETVGTLLADIAAIGLAGQTGFSGNQNKR